MRCMVMWFAVMDIAIMCIVVRVKKKRGVRDNVNDV